MASIRELLYPVYKRIQDCKTYNFGMQNADKLAHEDARRMHDALIRISDMALDTDGNNYEHNGHHPWEGEAECPGCWGMGLQDIIRRELTKVE